MIVLFLCVLTVCAYFDIKTRKIPIAALLLLIVVSLLRVLVEGMPDLLSFMMCGTVVFVCTILKKAVGKADVVCIMCAFLMFDASTAAKGLFMACMLAFLSGLAYYKGKARGKNCLLFLFFFLACYFLYIRLIFLDIRYKIEFGSFD